MGKLQIYYRHLNDDVAIMQIPKVASSLIFNSLYHARKYKKPYLFMDYDEIESLNKKVIFLTRNPFDRVVSAWENNKRVKLLVDNIELLNLSFDNFVKKFTQYSLSDLDRHLVPISRFHDLIAEKNDNIEWFKIEKDDPLPMISKLGGFEYLDVNKFPTYRNISKNRKHYKEYYDSETKKMVEEYYKEDLKRYDYKF